MSCFLPKNMYGVIGWPLAQSLSPLLHNTAFQALHISSIYMSWPIRPEDLATFMNVMPVLGIAGCSVTIPHKVAVLPYLDTASEAASLAGAANTLYWRDGALCGDNTDVAGFMSPLKNMDLTKMDVLLLGAGGAARAVAAGLKLAGCANVRVTSPHDKRQYELAERFGFTPVPWADRGRFPATLIVNATPLGMYGGNEDKTPYEFGASPSHGIAYDLVYNPLRTRFLREAEKAGRKIISGLEMFYGQGEAQFKLWTGLNMPQEARQALENALEHQ